MLGQRRSFEAPESAYGLNLDVGVRARKRLDQACGIATGIFDGEELVVEVELKE